MTKIVYLAIVLACSSAISFAKSHTPMAVTRAFNEKFSTATKVKWDKENAHNYEASFLWKGIHYSANFSDTGEWLETEIPISFDQLPEKVQTAFIASHKGVKAKAASQIEASKQGTIYEVEFKQGIKTIEVFYKADGTETKE